MKKLNYYYCDMDGVLADFFSEPNALERYENEKGFFKNLKPIKENVKALKDLIAKGESVRILSASPNKQADLDKIAWLKKYLPELKRKNIIICRVGDKKVEYMKTKKGVLFDDYSRNLKEWAVVKENKCCLVSVKNPIASYL